MTDESRLITRRLSIGYNVSALRVPYIFTHLSVIKLLIGCCDDVLAISQCTTGQFPNSPKNTRPNILNEFFISKRESKTEL